MVKRILSVVFVAVVVLYGASVITGCGDDGDGGSDGSKVYDACMKYMDKLSDCEDTGDNNDFNEYAESTCTHLRDSVEFRGCANEWVDYYECMTSNSCENIYDEGDCAQSISSCK